MRVPTVYTALLFTRTMYSRLCFVDYSDYEVIVHLLLLDFPLKQGSVEKWYKTRAGHARVGSRAQSRALRDVIDG